MGCFYVNRYGYWRLTIQVSTKQVGATPMILSIN